MEKNKKTIADFFCVIDKNIIGNCCFQTHCWGCLDCDQWSVVKNINLALCDSRHPMPSDVVGSIFPQQVNPVDIAGLQDFADAFFAPVKGCNLTVTIFVTGLTAALIAAINACKKAGLKVVLMHFNRDNGNFIRQNVINNNG